MSDADPVSWLVVEHGWKVVAADAKRLAAELAEAIG